MSCLDDFEFLLGVPTPAEMWQQHALLLEEEVADLQKELRELRKKLRTVIALRDEAVKGLSASKVEIDRLEWVVSKQNVELSEYAKRGFQHGYANDYGKEGEKSS